MLIKNKSRLIKVKPKRKEKASEQWLKLQWKELKASQKSQNDPELFLKFWKNILKSQDPQLNSLDYNSPARLYESILFNANKTSKHGIYYTPKKLAQYIIEQSLGTFLEAQRKKLLQNKDKSTQKKILSRIYQTSLCDPACGCGVFLLEALKVFHQYYKDFSAITQEPSPSANDMIRTQLFAADLDESAVLISQWSLIQLAKKLDQSTEKNIKENTELPIFYGNSLETNPEHFSWDRINRPSSGFDFITGNPPYLTEVRKHKETFQALKSQSRVSAFYHPKMDLADAFIYLGLDLLKPSGTLAYVLPEYWLQRDSARPLRKYLWQRSEIKELRSFANQKLFKNAPGQHSSVVILEKTKPSNLNEARPCQISNNQALETAPFSGLLFLSPHSEKLLFGKSSVINLVQKLSREPKLLASENIQQGIIFPQGRLRKKDWERLPLEIRKSCQAQAGIFILSPEEITSLQFNAEEKSFLKPYLAPSQFKAFSGRAQETVANQQILYIDNQAKKRIENTPDKFPQLRTHLQQFESINTSAHRPYGLHRARQARCFESHDKILCLRQTESPAFAHVSEPSYVNEGFYIINVSNETSNPLLNPLLTPLSIDVYTAILNSQLAHFWFYQQKRKGQRLQIDKEVLLSFPSFPKPQEKNPLWQKKLQALSQELRLNKRPEKTPLLMRKINQALSIAYQLTANESKLIFEIN